MPLANSLVILDFETTGLSPDMGDRAIEIGAVRIEQGEVVEQFQELMNPGFRVSGFIEGYTGITNAMLQDAAPCDEVMARFADFLGGSNMVAHNVSFDKRFLDAEFNRIQHDYTGEATCSLLAARRLLQNASDFKLGTLVKHLNLSVTGTFHRALYDSEMTAKVWVRMLEHIEQRYALEDIPFSLMKKLTKTPKKSVDTLLHRASGRAAVARG